VSKGNLFEEKYVHLGRIKPYLAPCPRPIHFLSVAAAKKEKERTFILCSRNAYHILSIDEKNWQISSVCRSSGLNERCRLEFMPLARLACPVRVTTVDAAL